MMGGVLEANAASSSHIPILLFIKKTHHPSNPNTVLFAISRRKSSPSQLFCRRLENRCSVLCHATRRKPRYDSSDNDDEEEYGHNSEISMLEFYSECNRDVALLVGATVDGEEEQVIIFKVVIITSKKKKTSNMDRSKFDKLIITCLFSMKGFSSLLSSGTFWDPSKSVLPARAKIRCVDIVKGPFDPSMVEYLETNLTPDDFKTRLKNTLNSDKNT